MERKKVQRERDRDTAGLNMYKVAAGHRRDGGILYIVDVNSPILFNYFYIFKLIAPYSVL